MHGIHVVRRWVVAISCVLSVLMTGSAVAGQWERLPNPGLIYPQTRIAYNGDIWTVGATAFCDPFMVYDGISRIYIGHPGLNLGATIDTYNIWMAYDIETGTVENLKSPLLGFFPMYVCATSTASGAFVDGKVYVTPGGNGQRLVYDPQTDAWELTTLPPPTYMSRQILATDEDHEELYWLRPEAEIGRADPENRTASEANTEPFFYLDRASMSVVDNKAYWAGGFETDLYGWKGGWYYYDFDADSSTLAYVYDFIDHTLSSTSFAPKRAAMVGSGWGANGLHYIGKQLQAHGQTLYLWYLPTISDYYVSSVNAYHFIYHPEADRWDIVDDLPERCIPMAATGAGEWLYGVFSCARPDDDPNRLALFRTYIGRYEYSNTQILTSTTTTINTTTTTEPTDDDADDDETHLPPLEDDAGDAGGGSSDDDGGCGCG